MEALLEEVLAEVRDSWMSAVHTSIPGKIVNYDASKQVADVQPQIKDFATADDGSTVARSYPLLASVPVVFSRGGGAFMAVPIKAGDTGLLVFSQLPIDRWRANGQESPATDNRRHSITSAVFFTGLSPRAKVIAEIEANTDLVIGVEGGSTVRVKPDGSVLLGGAPTDFVALSQLVAAELTRISGDLTTLKAAVTAGFTAVTPTGGGPAALSAFNSAASAVPSSPGSVAATKVKAD